MVRTHSDLESSFSVLPSSADVRAVVSAAWTSVFGGGSDISALSFFELGGDSLTAARIVGRLRRDLRCAVTVRDVFDHPTIDTLTDRVMTRWSAGEVVARPAFSIGRRDGERFPLSLSQERMWFLHQLDPNGAAYNIVDALRLRGELDHEALEHAVTKVFERHESLRTRFGADLGIPWQSIDPFTAVMVPRVVLAGEDREREVALSGAIDALAREPFDLERGPLARFSVIEAAPLDHVLVVSIHHIVGDQWSFGLLYRELGEHYRSACSGEDRSPRALIVQDVDHGLWHRSWVTDESEAQLDYWKQQLRDLPVLDIATDRARPAVQTYNGRTIVGPMPAGLRPRIDALASDHDASLFMVMLAAFHVLIGRYANTDDVVIGTAMANRSTPESEQVMSSLVNTVVIRSDLSGAPSFADVLARVRSTVLDALDHQDVPFTRVVNALSPARDMSRSPLFQVFFNVQNAPFELPELGSLDVEVVAVDRRAAQFDLSLSVDTTMSDLAALEYNCDLFDHARMERLFEHFWTVLDAAMAEPTRSIDELVMLTDAERMAFEDEWHRAEVHRAPATVVELFSAQAACTPHSVAVQFEDATVTYGELEARSNRIARHLVSMGVERGDLIGVHLLRSSDMVAVLLAIMKAGAAYIPLDPAFPADRLTYMASDAGLRLVFTQAELLDSPVVQMLTAIRIDDDNVFDGFEDTPMGVKVMPEDLAYVLYTSGSTGKPKGVQLEHRTVANFLRAMAVRPGMRDDDVLVAVTTLSFDISVLEIFLPLIVGARTVIVSRETAIDAGALIDVLASSKATIMQATPTTWRMLLESGWSDGKQITVLCGGEPMPRDLASSMRSVCRSVWNMYGPTETTVWSSVFPVADASAGTVPIGKAIDNTRLYVLDGRRQLAAAGVPGELYIGGDVLARGYLGRPELTDERFVADPFRPGSRMYRTGDVVRRLATGDLEFVGRIDNQVKVRGYRIELGEIEAVLALHPGVREAVVQPVDFGNDDARLVGYVIATDPAAPPESGDMRAVLQASLPDYMVPTAFVTLEQFPLTPNKKVDRKALPRPQLQLDERKSAPPLPGIESTIASIWEKVLGIGGIGRHDDFFVLGGHSLLAVRAFAQIAEATGQTLALSVLFRAPNIAELARHIEVPDVLPRWTSLVAVQPKGSKPPLFYVSPFLITALSFSHLARSLGADQPFYVLQPQGMEGDDIIHETLQDMAAHYIEEVKTVQPRGPYKLGGHCAGGWVAYEMAVQLQARGDEVSLLAVIDVEPPNIEPPKIRRFAYFVRRVRRYVRNGDVISAMRWKSSVNLERHLIRRKGDDAQRRIAELRRIHAHAHAGYRAGSLVRGDLLLLRSEEWASFPEREWHLRWAEMITGDLHVAVVPGSHAQLVESTNSEALARLIASAADDAASGVGAGGSDC